MRAASILVDMSKYCLGRVACLEDLRALLTSHILPCECLTFGRYLVINC